MAQMPRGEPRSVPDPEGERYDEMMRQGRLKDAQPAAARPPPVDFGPFSTSERLAPLRQQPRFSPTVTIGDRTYREIDNGRANVLVPAEDPLVSQKEMAARRQAIVQALFMADHPLAGAAYGIASLTNASPRARMGALFAGGLVDTAMLGAAPRGTSARSRPTVRQGQVASPTLPRPNLRLREVNAAGQTPGATATITEPMLGTGTKPNPGIRPPGWQGHGTIFNEARGHMIGAQLGGPGGDPRNLATLTQTRTNSPHMSAFENEVARRVRAGEVIEYSTTPLYSEGVLPPSYVMLTAQGAQGTRMARIIQNPAGNRR